jgi:hypothetical protein
VSVSALEKCRYCGIDIRCHFQSSAILVHGGPSPFKRSKSAFLLFGHAFLSRQATAGPKKKAAPPQGRKLN